MKKILFSVLLLFAINISYSQNETLIAGHDIIWFGVDYSHVNLVGGPKEFSDPKQIRDYYFNLFNDLILNENSKYPLQTWFAKDNVYIDLSFVKKDNKTANIDNLMVYEKQEMSFDTIKNIISKTTTTNTKTELGSLIIMENMIKTKNFYTTNLNESTYKAKKGYATLWVVLFNTSTKEIIACSKLDGRAKGVGFRNFWANSIHNAMKKYNPNKLTYDNNLSQLNNGSVISQKMTPSKFSKHCYFTSILELNSFFVFSKYNYSEISHNLYRQTKYADVNINTGLNTVNGITIKNNLFLGIGTGINFANKGRIFGLISLPLFLDCRYYFFKKKTQPFLDLSGGFLFSINRTVYSHTFINPSIGIRKTFPSGNSINLSLGYELFLRKILIYEYTVDSYGNFYKDTYELQNKIVGINIKWGVTF